MRTDCCRNEVVTRVKINSFNSEQNRVSSGGLSAELVLHFTLSVKELRT